jgi:hypothetical protein
MVLTDIEGYEFNEWCLQCRKVIPARLTLDQIEATESLTPVIRWEQEPNEAHRKVAGR